jgi:hypothetical protein
VRWICSDVDEEIFISYTPLFQYIFLPVSPARIFAPNPYDLHWSRRIHCVVQLSVPNHGVIHLKSELSFLITHCLCAPSACPDPVPLCGTKGSLR